MVGWNLALAPAVAGGARADEAVGLVAGAGTAVGARRRGALVHVYTNQPTTKPNKQTKTKSEGVRVQGTGRASEQRHTRTRQTAQDRKKSKQKKSAKSAKKKKKSAQARAIAP